MQERDLKSALPVIEGCLAVIARLLRSSQSQ